jgi:hypothetical protein
MVDDAPVVASAGAAELTKVTAAMQIVVAITDLCTALVI